jgi:hypothetical protein
MQRPRFFRWRARTVSRVLTLGGGFLPRGAKNTEWKIFGWCCIFGQVQLFCWKRIKCGDSNTVGLAAGTKPLCPYEIPITTISRPSRNFIWRSAIFSASSTRTPNRASTRAAILRLRGSELASTLLKHFRGGETGGDHAVVEPVPGGSQTGR